MIRERPHSKRPATQTSDVPVPRMWQLGPSESQADFESPNCVKVICNSAGHAIYFSREAIPFARDEESAERAVETALHHHGIYAYRCGVLRSLVVAEPSDIEVREHLEQLRAMSLGMTIAVGVPPDRPGAGIDTEKDLQRAARELQR